jgi:hypothetical protein
MSDDHALAYELRAALDAPGCPICALASRALRRYLSALANEGVMDRRQREVIRAAYGFCAVHGRALREGRDALGSAIIHRDLLANLSRALEAERPRPRLRLRRQSDARPLAGQGGCMACERVREAEQRYAGVLPQLLEDRETLLRFQASSGLCAPHLRIALGTGDSVAHARLREAQAIIWGRLIDELDEFIRKQDHRFAHEPPGSESDSWRRAIDLVAGTPECAGEG